MISKRTLNLVDGLDPVALIDGIVAPYLTGFGILAREGTTLKLWTYKQSLLLFPNHSQDQYISSSERLIKKYGLDNKSGLQSLDFLKSLSPMLGINLGDTLKEKVIIAARIPVRAAATDTLDVAVNPLAQHVTVANHFANLVPSKQDFEVAADGIKYTYDRSVEKVADAQEKLSTASIETIDWVGDRLKSLGKTFLGIFNPDVSVADGSAIVMIDADRDGSVDLVYRFPGTYDLDLIQARVTEIGLEITHPADDLPDELPIVGTPRADHLVGTEGSDVIRGVAGNNLIEGMGGADLLFGGLDDDVLDGGEGDDHLLVYFGSNTLIGAAGDDILQSYSAEHNFLVGGPGDDIMVRRNGPASFIFAVGWGNDVIDILHGSGASAAASDRIVLLGPIDLNALTFTVDQSFGTHDLVIAYGSETVRILDQHGGDSARQIEELVFNDQPGWRVFLNTPTPFVALRGTAGNDTLTGLAGNDILNGGPGNDLLDGGDGSDTAIYADAPGRVVVDLAIAGPQNTLGGGRDTLVSIENVTGTVFNDTLRGDAGGNRLDGGEGNDIIDGRDGNDILVGGAGTDTAEYRSAGAGVRVSLLKQGARQDTLGAGLDTLDGIENLTGSPFADVLIGDAGNNVLVGVVGDDILEGGEGNDRLDGGEGIDLASYEGAAGPVKVYLNSASATGAAGIDYFVSIEGFVGSAFDDTLVGNAGANVLRGGAGNDRLYGLDGDDVLRGGPGDDILYGGPGNDTADYSDAIVTVRAVLGVNATVNTTNFGRDRYFDIENLAGGAARDFLTGDAKANVLTGNGGNDIIAGAGGDDTLLGGEGNDDLTGGPGADLIDLGPAAGNDIVRYTSGADSRFAAMDRIVGFTPSGPGFDRIGFENAAAALFAGVAPTAIALGAKVTLASAASVGDLAAQLGTLAASGATTLALCQVDVAAGALAGSYLTVNDTLAGFDAASDMLIGIQFAGGSTLGAGNFFLF